MSLLNPSQEKAVRTVDGRLLVLAGAGSGKTRVIAHRITHLISDQGISPKAILGLTFTNKAAAEMRSRVESLIGNDLARQVTLATFHSFCMQVLRREIERLGYTRDFSLYDERDLERLKKQLVEEGTQDLEKRLKLTLRAYNAVSFDSLIELTVHLFEEYKDVLERYQNRFRYLMIDEYQDTNPAQFHLAELLAQKYNNLCVVGDDDQSIYGWRGADVSHILHFKADCTVKLEQNYRSTPIILEAANSVIRNNKSRHVKGLWSAEKKGEPIEVFNAPTDLEEAQAIVSRLLRIKAREACRWRDFAILYRSNALSRQFELALIQASWQKEGHWVRGVPYEVFGGLSFSERSEVKDLLAYLRVIGNPRDEEALLRILNVPRRGISDSFLDTLTQKNRKENIPLWHLLEEIAQGRLSFPNHPRGITGISSFVDLIENAKKRFADPPLFESLQWLLDAIDFKKAIEEEVKSEEMRAFKWENVQECINALAQYEEEASQEATLSDFIANTALARPTFAAHVKQSKEDRVQLMTLHSAKGLEFPVCFIAGLEDHILPHEKAGEVEEERRLFYVGITRAQKKLILSMARSRMRAGKIYPSNPSRFLFEIPKHLLRAADYRGY